jgi:hypothetical protein
MNRLRDLRKTGGMNLLLILGPVYALSAGQCVVVLLLDACCDRLGRR